MGVADRLILRDAQWWECHTPPAEPAKASPRRRKAAAEGGSRKSAHDWAAVDHFTKLVL
jgi:hypothetical protein